jgi:hypothetical protein
MVDETSLHHTTRILHKNPHANTHTYTASPSYAPTSVTKPPPGGPDPTGGSSDAIRLTFVGLPIQYQ